MRINQNIFKAYDIRGLYPKELDEKAIEYIGKAIATFVIEKTPNETPTIALSYDGRLSSPSLATHLKKALLNAGLYVIDIGMAGTPTLYFVVHHFGYNAGVQISASHNPKEYNGIKFVLSDKGIVKIGKASGLTQLIEIVKTSKYKTLGKKGKAKTNKKILEAYIHFWIKKLGIPPVKQLNVVADPANAVGALYIKKLFGKLPCKLTGINMEIDGNFPAHQPDPLQLETLTSLRKRVQKEHADLGIAADGDGDRIFFIDEKGGVVSPSLITALVAEELLKKQKGEHIMVDVRYTKNALRTVKQHKGRHTISPVGHALISKEMKRLDALFAGESSGHYYFRESGYADDPVPVILILLHRLAKEKKPISQIIERFKHYEESGEINFRVKNAQKLFKAVERYYKKQKGRIDKTDGLSITFSSWRCNIRSSNTEPLVRLNIEGKTTSVVEKKIQELSSLIKNYAL